MAAASGRGRQLEPRQQAPAQQQPQQRQREPATFEAYDPEAYGAVVHPNRFDWYLVTRWLPDLGNDGFIVVKVLRNELYYNPAKRALRDECEMSMEELARRCNLSRRTLFRLFEGCEALGRFVRRQTQFSLKGDTGPHRDVNSFRVAMTDPIHPSDEERYRMLLEQRGAEQLADSAGARRHRVKRSGAGDTAAVTIDAGEPYECHIGTHRASMSAKNDTYECQPDTHSAAMSAILAPHKENSLPPEVITKGSLPAARGEPPPAKRPPEGVGELAGPDAAELRARAEKELEAEGAVAWRLAKSHAREGMIRARVGEITAAAAGAR
jgi:AcrR family transcriptional regulator